MFRSLGLFTGTPRSDLFSLGVLTYQMLSGKLPYGDKATHPGPGPVIALVVALVR